MGFGRSNAVGKVGENCLIEHFTYCGYKCELVPFEQRSDYDIKVQISPRKTVTVEVKFDRMAQRTRNLAIEYYNPKSNCDSGLSSTKADLWCHVILDDNHKTLWITTVEQLKAFVLVNEPKKKVSAGGDSNADLYLYDDKFILSKVFHRLDTLDCKQTQKLIKGLI